MLATQPTSATIFLQRTWPLALDTETRFRTLAASGSAKKGLAILDKLDATEKATRRAKLKA